jgi:hypothetical protein
MKISEIPQYTEWQGVFEYNRALVANHNLIESTGIRAKLVDAAYQHTSEIKRIAGERGVSLRGDPTLRRHEQAGLLMAGHQPVIYHSGLQYKAEMLSRLSRDTGVLAINIVIDTDEGAGGKVLHPIVENGTLVTRSASLTDVDGLFMSQRIADESAVVGTLDAVAEGLLSLGLHGSMERMTEVAGLYRALAGVPVAIANSIVRWHFVEPSYLEVPFSQILALPEVRVLLEQWCHDGGRLTTTYNSVLDAHRAERKIKNPANPFPNMKVVGDEVELPMWSIDPAAAKRALIVKKLGTTELLSSVPFKSGLLAPRGSITTMLLRGYCSDIFIHGLGGAKYDPFVDALAKEYLGVVLPSFVVASKTRYFFEPEVARYEEALALKDQYKEIVSHTDRFFNRGIFTPEEESSLRDRSTGRPALVQELQRASDAATKSATAHQLNAINRDIKSILDSSNLAQRLRILDTKQETIDTWQCREFPFFFFD